MRLLLDAHLPKALAEELRRCGVDAVALSDWMNGQYRTVDEEQLLMVAGVHERTLVTSDCRTIPALLRQFAEMAQHHAGVVLISSRSFRSNDVAGLLSALRQLAERFGALEWQDRVVFLSSDARHE